METSLHTDREFQRLPFDLYQRYCIIRAAASAVRARLGHPLSVLDVGGVSFTLDGVGKVLPIRLCLPQDRSITLDSQECEDVDTYVKGVGECLPFHDNCFEIIVSCDTLEHVRPERRQAFIDELLRVSLDYVVLIVPCASHLTSLAERILDQYITHSLGVEHLQLREHLSLGLPAHEEILKILTDRHLAFVDFESGYLYSWLTAMLARHYLHSLPNSSQMVSMFDEFYNVAFSAQDHRHPGYRHVYVVSKLGNEDVLREVGAKFPSDTNESQRDAYGTGAEVFQMAMALLNLRRTEGADQELWKRIAQKEAHIAHLETLVVERDRAIADLRRALNECAGNLAKARADLEKTISWRIYAGVKRLRKGLWSEQGGQ